MGCDQNVRYRNPHRLSGMDGDAPMTIEQELEQMGYHCETIQASLDPLTDQRHEQDLPEIEAPHCIATFLFKHQKQALTFMLRRERGWNLHGRPEDVWRKTYERPDAPIYTNTITGDAQGIAPLPFQGGILADQTGLGKA
jgi:SWI/SNF-related matrix-associated actin-dependent regulator of chromatin subfamily A3